MRPFVERFVSIVTLLLAAFAMAQLAGAQTLPGACAAEDHQVAEARQHRDLEARAGTRLPGADGP